MPPLLRWSDTGDGTAAFTSLSTTLRKKHHRLLLFVTKSLWSQVLVGLNEEMEYGQLQVRG